MGIQAQKSFVSMAQIIIALVQASGETNTMANTNTNANSGPKAFVSMAKIIIALLVQASGEANTNTLANSGTKNLCVNGSNNYSFSSAG